LFCLNVKFSRSHLERVFGNWGVRRIFGFKRDGVTGKWRELYSEELSDLYISPNIFRVIKTRRKNWKGHVHFWGEERRVQGFGGELKGKENTW